MDPAIFVASAPGRLLRTAAADELVFAFLPDVLPPSAPLSGRILKLLDEANHLVGTLNGTARGLFNPNLLIQPFVRREAVLSSKIEGTVASFSDLVLYEADPTTSRRDAREVYNYVLALNSAIEQSRTLPVAYRLICETHARLMDGVKRESYAYPGCVREKQVYIGDERLGIKYARFIPPPPDAIQDLLANFEQFINGDDDIPLLIKLAYMHYQFETIHPFMDGNGRMGRLLITLLLCVHQRLSKPLLYLSAYFSTYKTEYYDKLLAVSTNNDWEEWTAFFLQGVIETAQDAVRRSEKLLDLHREYRQRLVDTRSGDMAQQLLDMLFEYPAFTIPKAVAALGSSYPTIQKATDKLVDRQIASLWKDSHHPKIYLSHSIIDILEDTKLLIEDRTPRA
jgi:Fic family protein